MEGAHLLNFATNELQLGGPEAAANLDLLACTNTVVTKELACLEGNCRVVEAANITQCLDGAPTPAPVSDIYFSPNQGTLPQFRSAPVSVPSASSTIFFLLILNGSAYWATLLPCITIWKVLLPPRTIGALSFPSPGAPNLVLAQQTCLPDLGLIGIACMQTCLLWQPT
jgi:hypothetical protein